MIFRTYFGALRTNNLHKRILYKEGEHACWLTLLRLGLVFVDGISHMEQRGDYEGRMVDGQGERLLSFTIFTILLIPSLFNVYQRTPLSTITKSLYTFSQTSGIGWLLHILRLGSLSFVLLIEDTATEREGYICFLIFGVGPAVLSGHCLLRRTRRTVCSIGCPELLLVESILAF